MDKGIEKGRLQAIRPDVITARRRLCGGPAGFAEREITAFAEGHLLVGVELAQRRHELVQPGEACHRLVRRLLVHLRLRQ